MENGNWTNEQIAAGYEDMAEINLALAMEFAALEEEAEQITNYK